MSGIPVLLVAGTHGNEMNAPWLINQWAKNPDLINNHDVRFSTVIGNPSALKACRRYLDRDLNRSFSADLLGDPLNADHEVVRARELVSLYGPQGVHPHQIVIDLHSTTSSMGSSLVVYGRRPTDLAFASLIQSRLGLPVYLHEGDKEQKGFLVEAWPCGLVIEVGPVPQAVIQDSIVQRTRLALSACFEEIAKVNSGQPLFPDELVVHLHLGSLDFPRDVKGQLQACIHQDLQGKDWYPLNYGDPLFVRGNGDIIRFDGDYQPIPVFINEAAYAEKKISMSLTKREVWTVSMEWQLALNDLVDI